MGLLSLHNKAAKEFTLRSHDKKLIPLLLLVVVILRITPSDLVLSIIQSTLFKHLVALNPFALRMANYGNKPQYALYCYGMVTLLIPYFLYVLFNSSDIRAGIAGRFKEGGRKALVISAFVCLVVFFCTFYIGKFNTQGAISRINYFIFYSKNGIALMSVGFTYLLILMATYFVLCGVEFYKNGGES